MKHTLAVMPITSTAVMEIRHAEVMGYNGAEIFRKAEEIAAADGSATVATWHVEDAFEALGIDPDVDATLANEGGKNA